MHLQKAFNNSAFFQRLITGLIFLVVFWSSFIFVPSLFSILIFAILAEILIFEWPKLFSPKDYKFWLIMPFYPILPFILLYLLNISEHRSLLAIMFILVFCFDSGAYVAGRLFGKHKLCPKISPGKTWEGVIGGFLTVILALLIIVQFLQKPISFNAILLYSLILSFLALTGDLFESYLKRRVGIKDTGSLLPGHGGFLDRFDAIMFLVVILYFKAI